MAIPTYVSAAGATGVGAISPAWGAGHQTNDIGIMLVETANEAITLTDAQGFVEVTNSPQGVGSAGTGARLAMYWCRATSSAMTAPTIADPGDHVAATIFVFRGCVQSGNPWSGTPAGHTDSSVQNKTFDAVTTTVNDCLVLNAVSRNNDLLGAYFASWANASLANVTEIYDAGWTDGNGGGYALCSGELATAGNSGQTTVTATAAVYSGLLTIALAPVDTSHALTSALVSDAATLSATMAVSRPHGLTAALTSGSATLSGTFSVAHLHDLTSALAAGSATLSGALLRTFPGSHNLDTIILNASHAAMNASFLRVTGKVFDGALVAGSATLAGTFVHQVAAVKFQAYFDVLSAGNYIPWVGATPLIKFYEVATGLSWDFNDSNFRSAATCVTLQGTMTAVDATYWPGVYEISIIPTVFDGEYLVVISASGSPTQTRHGTYKFIDGVLYEGGLLTDERAAVMSFSSTVALTPEEHSQLMNMPTLVWAKTLPL